LRAIAVTSLRPEEGFEAVPPVATTFPGFEFVGWVALFAPTGTSDDVVRRLNEALRAVVKETSVVQRLRSLGMTPSNGPTGEEMAAFISAERERWTRLTREIGFEPD
jgi:tripartite-type tricarboxylate transporter receptor subunit TctC